MIIAIKEGDGIAVSQKDGRGGAGRGQGRKPLFGKGAMDKTPIRLSPKMMDFIRNGGSDRLRRLLEWGQTVELLPDPGSKPKPKRTSMTLPDDLVEATKRLGALGHTDGYGDFQAGLRRVIHTAMEQGINPDTLD